MTTQPITILLLVSAVLSLILGPIVLLFVPAGNSAISTGTLLVIYGALALWIGMKQLEQARVGEAAADEAADGDK